MLQSLGGTRARSSLLLRLSGLLLALAFGLRVFALDLFPPGVQHDEVFVANFAQTILQGNYPIFFELNRGNEPLFMYLVAVMFRLFGENVWALRTTAALCGFGALLLTFLLARDLFAPKWSQVGDERSQDWIAFLTAGGITCSFWHLYESRIGLHAISTYLLAAATFFAFWRGWTRGNRLWLGVSAICAGLATYTYRSGIFVPAALFLFLAYSLILHRRTWGRNAWLAPLIVGVAALIYAPLFYFIMTHPQTALARLGDLSGDIESLGQGNPLPLLGNAVRVLGMFGVSGDPEWRYNVAGRPIFDPAWALLFYVGLLLTLWRFKRAPYALTLIWLVMMLLPSVLSGSDLSQHRAVGAIGAVYLLPALGLDEMRVRLARRWERAGRLAFNLMAGVLLLLAAAGGLNAYFLTWPQNPTVRAIQRADLAEAARWLDANAQDERVLVSAEFANDLDRGSFNLVSRRPHRAQFFQGKDTFVLPAHGDAFLVNPRTGPLADAFKHQFLAGQLPIYRVEMAGDTQVEIYRVREADWQRLRASLPVEPRAETMDRQIVVRASAFPTKVQTGDTLDVQVWWQVLVPQASDADGLGWVIELTDDQEYVWSEASSLGYTPSQWQAQDLVVSRFELPIPADSLPQKHRIRLTLRSARGVIPLLGLGQAAPSSFVILGETRIERGPVPASKPDLPVRYPSKTKFGEAIQLLGSDAVGKAEAGGEWRLALFWQAVGKILANYKLVLTATTEDGQPITQQEEILLRGVYPTKRWRIGDYVRSIHDLKIPDTAPRGKAIVRVSLWTPQGQPLGRADGAPIAGIEIVGRAHVFEPPQPQTEHRAQFGDAIELLGYDLPKSNWRAGEPLHLTLYWRALKPTPKPLTVFVHLLDRSGRLIGQKDSPPLNGQAPTDRWVSGEFLTDKYVFDIPADAPPGAAVLEIGWYDATSGQRLRLTDGANPSRGDHILIEGLTIER